MYCVISSVGAILTFLRSTDSFGFVVSKCRHLGWTLGVVTEHSRRKSTGLTSPAPFKKAVAGQRRTKAPGSSRARFRVTDASHHPGNRSVNRQSTYNSCWYRYKIVTPQHLYNMVSLYVIRSDKEHILIQSRIQKYSVGSPPSTPSSTHRAFHQTTYGHHLALHLSQTTSQCSPSCSQALPELHFSLESSHFTSKSRKTTPPRPQQRHSAPRSSTQTSTRRQARSASTR